MRAICCGGWRPWRQPREPRRVVEQHRHELPLREPQQEQAGEPEQQPGLPPRRSSACHGPHGPGLDGTGRRSRSGGASRRQMKPKRRRRMQVAPGRGIQAPRESFRRRAWLNSSHGSTSPDRRDLPSRVMSACEPRPASTAKPAWTGRDVAEGKENSTQVEKSRPDGYLC